MTATTPPILLWLRRDLRLADHPGCQAALATGAPVIPIFILDPLVEQSHGAAPLWRLGRAIETFDAQLRARGSRLILRRGEALDVLRGMIAETGATRIVWSRLYDSRSIERDREIKAALTDIGVSVASVNASLLAEPWTVATEQGAFYKVFTPFWKAIRTRDMGQPLPEPADLAAPESWPASDLLADWRLAAAMDRGAVVVERFARIGKEAARKRLDRFVDEPVAVYKTERDRPDRAATSKLSENLAYGEISPRTIWHAGRAAMERGAQGAEPFLGELGWREFAYHLLYHTPGIETQNWRPEWNAFPWRGDNPDAERWRRGMTGVELVDAGMREMYVTGTMHNRLRMVTASFLTKHLMTDWRVGDAWFRDCLIDWDTAANALGWQWVAGSGPDAAPYFRIFNPDTQAEKFDPDRAYRDRFLAEGRNTPHEDAQLFFDAVPRSWGLAPSAPYPAPLIGLKEGRERALAAYGAR